MPRLFVFLSIIVLLGFGIWLIIQPGSPTAETNPGEYANSEDPVLEAAGEDLAGTEDAVVQRSELPIPAVDAQSPEAEAANKLAAQLADGALLLKIQVIDQDGVPVQGAKVGFQWNQSWMQRNLTAITEADGWTEILLEADLVKKARHANCSAVLMGLVGVRKQQQIDLKNLPEQGVVIQMPPSGTITVEVLDQSGVPFLKPTSISLLIPGQLQDKTSYIQVRRVTSDTGKAEFSGLDFRKEFRVQAVCFGEDLVASVSIEGPTQTGPSIHVKLELKSFHHGDSNSPYLVGRILDSEGKAYANQSLDGYLRSVDSAGTGTSTRFFKIETDVDGRFRQMTLMQKLKEGSSRSLVIVRASDQDLPFAQQHKARIELNHVLPPGDTDVGDLNFKLDPLAVSGVVLKADGSPLADASVSLEFWDTDMNGWRNGNYISHNSESLEDGSFSIRGSFSQRRYRVHVHHPRHSQMTQEIELGESDLTFQFPATGGLQWDLQVDEDIPVDGFKVRVEYVSGGPTDGKTSGRVINLNKTGPREIYGLLPGIVDLVILCRDTEEELIRLRNIEIEAKDQFANDVGVIDLRKQLNFFSLLWRGVDGKMLTGVEVYPEGSEERLYSWRGSLLVITTQASRSFRACPKGYLAKDVLNVSTEQTITFQKGVRVLLQIENPEVLPEESIFLFVVYGVDTHNKQIRIYGERTDSTGARETALVLEDLGGFRVEGCFAANGRWNPIQDVDEQPRIQLSSATADQVFRIHLDPEAVAKTHESLQK